MRIRRILLVLTFVAALLAAGVVLSSNMGFKHAPTYTELGKDYWVSLPYKSNLADAAEVCGVVPNASLVSRFDTAGNVRVDWTCPFGTNFSLAPGEGVFLRVTSTSNPVFVGSHDPDLFVPSGGFTITGRDYLLSIPYHTTATTATDICAEVPSATLISRFDTATGGRVDWTCPFGTDFSIVLGEALMIRVGSAGPGFQPDHY